MSADTIKVDTDARVIRVPQALLDDGSARPVIEHLKANGYAGYTVEAKP